MIAYTFAHCWVSFFLNVIFGPCLRHLDIQPAYLGIEPLQPWLLYVNIICKLTDEPELHPQVLKIFQPTGGPPGDVLQLLEATHIFKNRTWQVDGFHRKTPRG